MENPNTWGLFPLKKETLLQCGWVGKIIHAFCIAMYVDKVRATGILIFAYFIYLFCGINLKNLLGLPQTRE